MSVDVATARHRVAAAVSVVAGILLGTCALLGAKMLRPDDGLGDPTYYHLVDAAVPAYDFESVSGEAVSSHGFRGKRYLLFVGDAACESCQDVLPIVVKRSSDLPVVAVTMDEPEALAEALEVLGGGVPVVLDTAASIGEGLGIESIPTAMLVDEDGRIEAIGSGSRYAADVMQKAR